MAIDTSGAHWVNRYSEANRTSFYNSFGSNSSSEASSSNSLYGVNTSGLSSNAQNFLVDAKSSASSLQGAINSLRSGKAFDEKTAVSSDKDVLAIKSVDSKYAKSLEEITVKVDQIAQAQKNVGSEMSASGKNSLGSGYKQFEIETDAGKKTQIMVKIGAGDNNEAVQKKIAEAINNKNIGLTAKVTTENGKSTLSVESVATGVKNEGRDNFTIRDLTAGGGIAEWAGITKTTQKAQDAVYSINGGEAKTSKSNDIDLGNGVTATLKSASETEVKIGMGKDTLSGINAVREMVNGFNSLLEAAEENKDDRRTSFLYNQLKQLTKTYESRLTEIGISFNSDGYLSIDETKMKAAAEDGKLENFFKSDGVNFGFSSRLERISGDVNRDPSQYVSRQATNNSSTNYSRDYLQEYRYSQMVSQGMLFDSLF